MGGKGEVGFKKEKVLEGGSVAPKARINKKKISDKKKNATSLVKSTREMAFSWPWEAKRKTRK